MKRNNKRQKLTLEDLTSMDLGSFGILGGSEENESLVDETPIIDTDPIVDESGIGIEDINNFKYKVVLHNGCKSCKEIDLKFTNSIESLDLSSSLNSKLIEILKMEGKVIKASEIKLTLEEKLDLNHPTTGTRVKKILNRNGILESDIDKSKYEDAALKGFAFNTRNDFLRVYTSKNIKDSELKVLIFDPYHLLATEKTERFESIKHYGGCICELHNKFKRTR